MVTFYRWFVFNPADTILSLTNLLSDPKGSFKLPADALTDFEQVKAALANIILLRHFPPDAHASVLMQESTRFTCTL
ncbi:unnamed protein product [Schistocephalus solidus]|uniref:Uncharacterized protein n=1 Tax=Schistocephalus solidus TaxID=70667 RepID=A0A183TI14_SCHSO|nr:unnamed protein product [Schistocephalus solidus]